MYPRVYRKNDFIFKILFLAEKGLEPFIEDYDSTVLPVKLFRLAKDVLGG
jgi:hypothetical protein